MKKLARSELIKRYSAGERDFSGIELESSADLSGLDLRGINLSDAILEGATISNAILIDANLSNINIDFVLSNSDLSGANLRADS